jgi:hypothetical protein
MKVGIMQPYFFPYIGYFQLIKAVDVYVNLDHVSFMKRSYMTRNTLKNSVAINLQVAKGSQNKSCKEVYVNFNPVYLTKLYKTLQNLYSKSPFFDEIMGRVIEPYFKPGQKNVSEFNLQLIKQICEIIGIHTNIVNTSSKFESSALKKEMGLQGITQELHANVYVNAIGGKKLYSKENFKEAGIDLFFIESQKMDLENPYASILHQLMVYSPDHLSNQVQKFNLI